MVDTTVDSVAARVAHTRLKSIHGALDYVQIIVARRREANKSPIDER